MIRLCFALLCAVTPSDPQGLNTPPDGFPRDYLRAYQQLGSFEESARIDAIKTLREFTDPRFEPLVIQGLVEALDDASFRVRAHAVFGLGFFGSRAVAHVDRIKACLDDPRIKVRVGAVFAVSQLDHPTSLSLLVQALDDTSEFVRGTIERALCRAEPELVLPLLTPALEHSLSTARLSAVKVLAHAKIPATLTLVTGATRDPDSSVRLAAIQALGEFGLEGALALTHLMEDADPQMRRQALNALSHVQDPAVRTQLLKNLNHPDRATRLHSLTLLANYNHPESVRALITHLPDPDLEIRLAIVDRLGSFGPDASPAVTALLPLLQAPEASMRVAVALALGHCQHPKAIPALRQALSDPDPDVRDAVRQALAMLGEIEGDLFHPRH